MRAPVRWAALNPVPANSPLVTTGTGSPENGRLGWKVSGSTLGRASPDAVRHRNRLRTSSAPSGPVPTTRTRYPTTPWPAGGRPVVIDVSAVAVVVGTTDVIGPPARPAMVGARSRRASS